MKSVISLDLNCDADFDRWQNYVLARPDTGYADLGQWRRIFSELYGIRSLNLACIEDHKTVGVASLYRIASPFFGRLLITCPFFGYGGLYANDDSAQQLLLESIERAATELDVDFVELRLGHEIEQGYEVNRDFAEFELELEGSAECVWKKSLSSNVRQNVRKSRQHGLRFSTTRDPKTTFTLLSETLRDLGTPFHSQRFFELLVEHLGDHVRFSQVHLKDRLVAAGVLMRFRERMATPYIGSLKRFRATRANYCQYWGIIEHCLETGVRCFDLGRSPRGSSHDRFKRKWGALPVEVHYCHRAISDRRSYRTVSEPGRVELWASGIWKRLPLAFTSRLGHRAYRYIP